MKSRYLRSVVALQSAMSSSLTPLGAVSGGSDRDYVRGRNDVGVDRLRYRQHSRSPSPRTRERERERDRDRLRERERIERDREHPFVRNVNDVDNMNRKRDHESMERNLFEHSSYRDGDRYRERDIDRNRDRDWERESDRDAEWNRDRDRLGEFERDRNRERIRDRPVDRRESIRENDWTDRDRLRERERDHGSLRNRTRSRSRSGSRSPRGRDKERITGVEHSRKDDTDSILASSLPFPGAGRVKSRRDSHWYFTFDQLRNSESVKAGMTFEEEKSQITETCRFIYNLGLVMRLPFTPIATAIVFFQRYFRRHALQHCDRWVVSVTCLFLAGKVEDVPKPLADTIREYYKMKLLKDRGEKRDLSLDSQEYFNLRENVLIYESILLQTLAFDFNVSHPYRFVVSGVKALAPGNKDLAQTAWNFVNDSLHSPVCLMYSPKEVAAGCLLLANKYLKLGELKGPDGKAWYEMFQSNQRNIDDIMNEILSLFDGESTLEQNSVVNGNHSSVEENGATLQQTSTVDV